MKLCFYMYLHGTTWLFLYGNGMGLTTEGCRGVWGALSLVKCITKGLGFLGPSLSVDCMHRCGSSSLLSLTSSRPWSIICCNRSPTAKHASMLCGAPGCIKQKPFSCPPRGITPPLLEGLIDKPYGGRYVLQMFGPAQPTRLDGINSSPSMIGKRVCLYVGPVLLKC